MISALIYPRTAALSIGSSERNHVFASAMAAANSASRALGLIRGASATSAYRSERAILYASGRQLRLDWEARLEAANAGCRAVTESKP